MRIAPEIICLLAIPAVLAAASLVYKAEQLRQQIDGSREESR